MSPTTSDFDDDPADAEIIDQIKELIETRVRPAVAQDGGDIAYKGYQGRPPLSVDARRLLGLPVLDRHPEARHRKPDPPLCARSGNRSKRFDFRGLRPCAACDHYSAHASGLRHVQRSLHRRSVRRRGQCVARKDELIGRGHSRAAGADDRRAARRAQRRPHPRRRRPGQLHRHSRRDCRRPRPRDRLGCRA